jgi:F-type H+-transporting ATPase subunit epsilon
MLPADSIPRLRQDPNTMAKLRVQIVTAEREVLSETDVDMVVAPGVEGAVGILPRHAPLLTPLQPGMIRIKKGDAESAMSVGGGFIQVSRDRVLILADTAEREEEVDSARAEDARKRAQEALENAMKGGTPVQVEAARIALRREMARINVAQRRRRGSPVV